MEGSRQRCAQANPQPGDLIYVDRHHDGVIDEKDKTMIGNPHPDWRLGFSVNLGWKGFDFSVTTSGAFGQQLYYGTRQHTIEAFDRWHGEVHPTATRVWATVP